VVKFHSIKVSLPGYDGLGRLIQVTLPNGETTSYTYDNNGNVLTMTDAAGNVTAYEYDYRNLLVRLIRAGGRTGEPGSYTYDFSKITSYTYTSDGRVSTVTDRNGAVTVCVYDIHGNLLSRTVTEGAISQSISYTYDHNGNVLTMTDGTGTTTRTYDAWNRTTSKTVPDIGTSFYNYDITDGFDAGCSAESTVDPKGNVTVKVYDRVGRLIYVLADSMTTSYAYYDDGSLQSVVYGNGSREDYTYTADKLLKTLVNKAIDGTTIDSYEYTYDAAHNLLSKTDSKGVTGYTYDAMNRLLTVTEPSGKITAYTYDAAGNRSSQTETEGTDVTATTYTYDALNRLLRTSESFNGTLARTVDYSYDNNGNLLTVTSVTYTDGTAGSPVLEQNNTYDLLNQLIRTVTSDGTTVENTYNGDGLRVVKSVNGSATRFLYQYDKIVLELNALGDQMGRNVYGLNLISRTFGEDTFFYFYNGHADVTVLVASDGTIAATYYYDAFGNILDQTGTATSNILYAGYQYDPETGLYYLNARMYDPVTARFIQEDSYLGERNDPLSLNLYTYCHNEPMMYSDPTGHREVEGTEIGGHTEHKKVVSKMPKSGSVPGTKMTQGTKPNSSDPLQNFLTGCENFNRTVSNISETVQGIPMKVVNAAVDGFNSCRTQTILSIEKKLNIDTNNDIVKGFNSYGEFITGLQQAPFLWALETATSIPKLANPLHWTAVGYQLKDTATSNLATPMWQNVIAEIKENPGDIGNNYLKFAAAGTVTEWNLISSAVVNTYNEVSQDPYKAGQLLGKIEIDVAMLFIGVGEATAASDAEAVEGVSKVGSEIGTSFGKMGTLVENPSINVNWDAFAEHGIERMTQRGVTQEMVNSWVADGKVLQQGTNKYLFVTQEGAAVVTKEGKLVTTYSSLYYDEAMIKIVDQLYGI